MALEYLAYNLLENGPVDNAPSVNRRDLRDTDNPFELASTEFKKLYRLSPELAEEIVFQLDGLLKGSRITGISAEKQVLATLRFYATGCYQRPVGEQWGISMSQASTEFKKLYRLSPELAEEIVFQLDGLLKGSRITGISAEIQVLATLRFYATGCYQRPVGEQWGISMSQSSVSRCIYRVMH